MTSNSSVTSFSTMRQIQLILMQISIPYIIIVSTIGMAGNVLTIIMLSKRTLTKTFNNCTLIALALTDLVFNLTLVSRCMSDLMEFDSDDFCRLLSFLSHLAELLSAGFTVHFTVQRFFAVKFPLSMFVEKNLHLVHYIIVSLLIIFGVAYCLSLIHQNAYENCQEELHLSWFLSDALLSFVIPFTIIAVSNCSIIFHLRATSQRHQQLSLRRFSRQDSLPNHRSPQRRTRLFMSYDSTSHSRISEHVTMLTVRNSVCQYSSGSEANDPYPSMNLAPPRAASIRSTSPTHAQSYRVTRMLILVSTCFLLLNAPSHICTISLKIYTLKKAEYLSPSYAMNRTNTTTSILESVTTAPQSSINVRLFQSFYILMIIAQHISYLSYSINFFLYSFCGMKFRRELLRFFSKCTRRSPRAMHHKPTDRGSV